MQQYQSQCRPELKPVIQPNFYWDFGPNSPMGIGKNIAIFSNCDRLGVFINNRHLSSLVPDWKNYPKLQCPPFFTDIEIDGSAHPELKIESYEGTKMLLSRKLAPIPNRTNL